MWQCANTFFDCTYIGNNLYFIKYLYLPKHGFETMKVFIHKRGWLYLVEISNYLKLFIIFKIFCAFNIVSIYNQECLKEFKYWASGTGGLFSKIIHFCCTEAGLRSKWVRISPPAFWWHQNQSSYIVTRRATLLNVAGKLADYWLYKHRQTTPCIEAAPFLKITILEKDQKNGK